jgi:hypothetical protein
MGHNKIWSRERERERATEGRRVSLEAKKKEKKVDAIQRKQQ